MKYRIEYISTFHADITLIERHLAEYPQKVMRIFAKTDRLLQHLEDIPEMYPIYRDVPTFRFFVIEDHLVFYKINYQNRIVEVHRMLYCRMNIPKYL